MTSRPARRSRFPDPRTAPADAPLAWGGDLKPATLLDAYSHGIFPWPVDERTVFWWSPDPRALIWPGSLHVSRSLRRTLRAGRYNHTVDAAFDEVVAACAHRPGQGTWITPAMRAAYRRLHLLGYAHSLEVWAGPRLAGGVYGVALGAAFMGESMFHRETDASKVALAHLMAHLAARGFAFLDAQMPTPHLERLGATRVARDEYLDLLALAVAQPARFADV